MSKKKKSKNRSHFFCKKNREFREKLENLAKECGSAAYICHFVLLPPEKKGKVCGNFLLAFEYLKFAALKSHPKALFKMKTFVDQKDTPELHYLYGMFLHNDLKKLEEGISYITTAADRHYPPATEKLKEMNPQRPKKRFIKNKKVHTPHHTSERSLTIIKRIPMNEGEIEYERACAYIGGKQLKEGMSSLRKAAFLGHEKALEHLMQLAIRNCPPAMLEYGIYCFKNGEQEEARSLWNKLLSLKDPTLEADLSFCMGALCDNEKKFDDAVAYFTEVLKSQNDKLIVRAAFFLGMMYEFKLAVKHPKSARLNWERAHILSPENIEVNHQLGALDYREYKVSKEKELLENAVKRLSIAAFSNDGAYKELEEIWNEERVPNAALNLGLYFLQRGDMKKAREFWEAVLKTSDVESKKLAHENIIKSYYDENDIPRIVMACQCAVADGFEDIIHGYENALGTLTSATPAPGQKTGIKKEKQKLQKIIAALKPLLGQSPTASFLPPHAIEKDQSMLEEADERDGA